MLLLSIYSVCSLLSCFLWLSLRTSTLSASPVFKDGGPPVLPPKRYWGLSTRLQRGFSPALASGEDVFSLHVTCCLVGPFTHFLPEKVDLIETLPLSRLMCGRRYGGLAVLLQTSPESANIFVLLQRMFRKQTPTQLQQVASAAGLSDVEYKVLFTPHDSECCSSSQSIFHAGFCLLYILPRVHSLMLKLIICDFKTLYYTQWPGVDRSEFNMIYI